ncbi:T9SS type A sorting domain-containing protein, partial [Hymenobacter sp. BT770]|uniref:T9SS type A sorting domain-containing protein n=1 Tax=Hymenobacter sp. BT770 TaxID=2886942 RepID=UPI001D12B2B2
LVAGVNIPVSVSDANGCTSATTVTIAQPTLLSVTAVSANVLCFGGTGSITVTANGGTPGAGYRYALDGGAFGSANVFSGLRPGIYNVSVIDANNCIATRTDVRITEPALLGITLSNLMSATCTTATGSATLTATGGTAPYTYSLQLGTNAPIVLTGNGAVNFTGLLAGTYQVLVRDANNCTATCAAITIEGANAVTLNRLSVIDATCFGGTGSFTVVANGGSGYQFSLISASVVTAQGTINNPPYITLNVLQSSATFSGLPAGTYGVRVIAAGGCTATVNVAIGQPAQLVLGTPSVTQITCFGANNGRVQLSATGGTRDYTFTLDGMSNGTGLFTNLAPGVYPISVRDANGCVATGVSVIILPQPARLSVIFSSTVNACGSAAGQATVSAVGGTAPYTYQLRIVSTNSVVATSPAVNGSYNFTGLAASTYQLVVTDARGCVAECPTLLQITNACSAFSSNGSSSAKSADQIVVYPNPFKEKATVEFRVAEGEHYSLAIYDMVGRVVSRVAEGTGEANHTYQVVVGQGLEEGIYMMRLTLGNKVKSVRLHVQK